MKALVGAFNQEKVPVGAFSVSVKTYWETDGSSAALRETVADDCVSQQSDVFAPDFMKIIVIGQCV